MGNILSNKKIKEINLLKPLPYNKEKETEEITQEKDTIEIKEVDDNKQISLDL